MRELSLLIKPTSSCNMQCSYCFYSDEKTSRKVADRGIMTLETLDIIVRRAMEETQKNCTIGFQGGEPTLAGLDFYKTVIDREKRYNHNNVTIVNTFQTNGTLLDNEWANFFAENRFLVGLSIDGEKHTHDLFRTDSAGKGTFNTCIKAAKILRNNRVDFNILTVVTRQLAAHPDRFWKFIKQQDFRYLQLIPCIDSFDQDERSEKYALDNKIYANFLCRIFDLWYQDFTQGNYYSIRSFDNYIRILRGEPAEACAMSGQCQAYAMVEADGTVYPCDFYALDNYLLGNVKTYSFQSMLKGVVADRFITQSLSIPEECAACRYYILCRAGCRRDREPVRDNTPVRYRYCSAHKEFFAYAGSRIAMIAANLNPMRYQAMGLW